MTVMIQGSQLRTLLLGTRVAKQTGTLAAETKALFVVTGGQCLITSMYGLVTTAVTVVNSYKIQANPTVGTTSDIVAATDIGTTDTPAGNILGFTGVKTDGLVSGPGSAPVNQRPIVVSTGTIEHVSAGTDGDITWVLTYVPLSDGAAITAA